MASTTVPTATMEQQHVEYDKYCRSSKLDYVQLEKDALVMIDMRVAMGEGSDSTFKTLASSKFPKFVEQCPEFFKNISSVEFSRLGEFKSVMGLLMGKLKEVQEGKTDFTGLRHEVFEKKLANMYTSRK